MTGSIKKIPMRLLLLLVCLFPASAGAGRIAVGEPFPDLTLPSLDDGSALSVTSFRGQKLVLHVFASW